MSPDKMKDLYSSSGGLFFNKLSKYFTLSKILGYHWNRDNLYKCEVLESKILFLKQED